MEHALHLAAKHFVKDVSPTSASTLLKKVKGAMVNATGEKNEMDLDALNVELDSIEVKISEDDDEGDTKDYDVADTVGKALALVTAGLTI